MRWARLIEPIRDKPPVDPKVWRSTAGLCFGLRPGLNDALVVLATKRADPLRTLYVVNEWEAPSFDFDAVAAALKEARKIWHCVLTVGYHGGRDDKEVFATLSRRVGSHVQPSPTDLVAPTSVLIDDVRAGRIKAREGSAVERDLQRAIWQGETPEQTGIIAALRCACWAAAQYRPVAAKVMTSEEKQAIIARERQRKREIPW